MSISRFNLSQAQRFTVCLRSYNTQHAPLVLHAKNVISMIQTVNTVNSCKIPSKFIEVSVRCDCVHALPLSAVSGQATISSEAVRLQVRLAAQLAAKTLSARLSVAQSCERGTCAACNDSRLCDDALVPDLQHVIVLKAQPIKHHSKTRISQ